MAVIDFHAVKVGIKALIDADSAIDAQVEIEKNVVGQVGIAAVSRGGWVGIYLERADTEDEGDGSHPISAGQSERLNMDFLIVCAHFHLNSIEAATELRDDLAGKVHLALMAERTLGGTVQHSYCDGMEFDSGRLDDGADFLSLCVMTWRATALISTS
jgi:hypothetical protein